jgi:hypothetical protein
LEHLLQGRAGRIGMSGGEFFGNHHHGQRGFRFQGGVAQGTVRDQLVPEGRAQVKRLLELAKVQMPKKLRYTGSIVATRKQLKESRPKRCK